MPPRNTSRSLLTEASLAERIAFEREQRGWTYEGLAKRMTEVGCAMNLSGLYKIEKGEPRRRITVDELVALSLVFDVPVEELLLPPVVAHSKEAAERLIAWNEARQRAADANAEVERAWAALTEHVREHPEITEKLEEMVGAWADFNFEETHREEATAYWLYKITDDSERKAAYVQRVIANMDAVRGDRG